VARDVLREQGVDVLRIERQRPRLLPFATRPALAARSAKG
jgi:hypothetical protein